MIDICIYQVVIYASWAYSHVAMSLFCVISYQVYQWSPSHHFKFNCNFFMILPLDVRCSSGKLLTLYLLLFCCKNLICNTYTVHCINGKIIFPFLYHFMSKHFLLNMKITTAELQLTLTFMDLNITNFSLNELWG